MRHLRDMLPRIPRATRPLLMASTYLALVVCMAVSLIQARGAADQHAQQRANVALGSASATASAILRPTAPPLATPTATRGPTTARVVPPGGAATTPTSTLTVLPIGPEHGPTPTPTPTPSSGFYFSDNFSGSTLGPAWTVINRHGEYAQFETECNVPSAVSVANNILTITTTKQQAYCGDFNLDGTVRTNPTWWPYTTGDVQWTNLSFTFGTVTYRARFPAQATSTWPAIWLLGSNCQATNIVTADVGYDTCPALGAPGYVEIDMTECYGSSWCQLALDQPSSFPTCQYPVVDDNWHTYSMTWTSSAISVAVDGMPTGCSYSAANGYVIPQTPMFLIIQTQTGGSGGTPNDSTLPTTLQVSNVTVTQP